MPVVKPTAVFTRDNPCTKVHIWNCFVGSSGFRPVMVVESRGEIGLNTPKYLLREGFAHAYAHSGVDYYELTESGRSWLILGLRRHLELHPDDSGSVQNARFLHPASTPRRRPVRSV